MIAAAQSTEASFQPLRILKTSVATQFLKIKLFLLYTLPIFVLTLAKAVLQEYGKIKTRQAAMNADNELNQDENNNSSEPQ